MPKIDRLMGIILMLQSKRTISAHEIADYFDVSVRTIYRDIQTLDKAGVPIVSNPREGYSLIEGYHLPPVMFTAEEASALFLGAEFVLKATDPSLHKPIILAYAKILSILPEQTKDYIEKIRTATHLSIGIGVDRKYDNKVHSDVLEGIVNNKVLKIEYFAQSRGKLSSRYIEPLGIVYYGGAWHLIAYCQTRKDFRDFRMDRIKTLLLTSYSFKPLEKFIPSKYVQKLQTLDKLNSTEVKLFVRKDTADEIRIRFRYGYFCDEETKDGFIFTYLVPNTELLKYWVISYGEKIKILQPKILQNEILERAKAICGLYKNND